MIWIFVVVGGLIVNAIFWGLIIQASRSYKIRLKERTAWGDLFDIVAPNGEVVGFDRYVVAQQRCAHLNSRRDSSPQP